VTHITFRELLVTPFAVHEIFEFEILSSEKHFLSRRNLWNFVSCRGLDLCLELWYGHIPMGFTSSPGREVKIRIFGFHTKKTNKQTNKSSDKSERLPPSDCTNRKENKTYLSRYIYICMFQIYIEYCSLWRLAVTSVAIFAASSIFAPIYNSRCSPPLQ